MSLPLWAFVSVIYNWGLAGGTGGWDRTLTGCWVPGQAISSDVFGPQSCNDEAGDQPSAGPLLEGAERTGDKASVLFGRR